MMHVQLPTRRLATGLAALALGLGALTVAATEVHAAPPAERAAKTAEADLVIHNAKIHVGNGEVIEHGAIVVEDGKIARVVKGAEAPQAATIIDAGGKIVTPGFIGADTTLGLVEIDLERSTRDTTRGTRHHVRASYDPAPAIFADSSLIPIQMTEGITTAAVAPRGGLIPGQVAWIDLLPGDYPNIVAERGVAMTANYGQVYGDSRAATLAELRRVLDDARFYNRQKAAYDRRALRDLAAHPGDLEALSPVLAGEIPLTVHAHRAGDILALIELAEDYDVDLVIIGGAEAWKVAEALAAAKVPVVLRPSQNLPGSLDQLAARLDNAALLDAAGVDVVIANPGDAHNIRNIKQEAGIAVAYGMPRESALEAVTLGVARAYGLDDAYGSVEVGKVANLVIWPADPFELSTFPEAVIVRGQTMPMQTRQTLLRDRYMKRHGLTQP